MKGINYFSGIHESMSGYLVYKAYFISLILFKRLLKYNITLNPYHLPWREPDPLARNISKKRKRH